MLFRDENRFFIPPKTAFAYENFDFITETASYKIFEAKSRNSGEKHTIRVLDPTKTFVANNFDGALTLFIQELLHLQNRCSGSVIINTLEINKDLKHAACAIHPYGLLSLQLNEIGEKTDLKNPKVIEKLLNDVMSDVEFLWRDLQMRNIKNIVNPESIYYFKKNGTFFLGSWDRVCETSAQEPENLMSLTVTQEELKLNSQSLAAEIKALAFALLKMKKADIEELETFQSMPKITDETYNSAAKSLVVKGFNDFQEPKNQAERLRSLIEKMFSRDSKNLPSLDEFKIKEDKIQVPFEEPKINRTPTSTIENTPPKLLAWCSYQNNKVSIMDLETKQDYMTFDGAKIGYTIDGWTHVKEMSNTKLLVSLHHHYSKSANMEIFDISKKGKAKKIYSLREINGVTGTGDVTYNSRRNILGAISLEKQIAYHLFGIDASASNVNNIVKLNRKSKWHPEYSTGDQNSIIGLDFNPAGEIVATIDRYGVLLISEVNTDRSSLHLNIGGEASWTNRCRWIPDEPLLYIKYDKKQLNILDMEKQVFTLTSPVQFENSDATRWIDVCQSNGNLLASGGEIFDKRGSKVVRTFDDLHASVVYCMKWSPSGDKIATASGDSTVKLLDFNSGKVIHTGKTSDGKGALSVCFV